MVLEIGLPSFERLDMIKSGGWWVWMLHWQRLDCFGLHSLRNISITDEETGMIHTKIPSLCGFQIDILKLVLFLYGSTLIYLINIHFNIYASILLNHEYHKVHTIYSFSDFYKCYLWKISHEALSSSQQYFMPVFLQVFVSSLLLLTTAWKWKKVKVVQSCPTFCSPVDSTAHGVLQARILEWVASLFSRGSSQTRDWTQVSCIAGEFFTSWDTKKPKNTGVGSLSLFQRIFPTQESNQGLLNCRQIPYKQSYQESPTIT